MKLYVCWGTFRTFRSGHPCRNALDAHGHRPEVIRSYGWELFPAALNRSTGRRLAREATGKSWLPLLVTDDGQAVAGSHAIRAWAGANEATDRRS
jgi:hypothetical protein